MFEPAPGRLSTMRVCPSSRPSGSARVRARKSPEPPGGKPTTRRIGRAAGQAPACARAGRADAVARANAPAAAKRRRGTRSEEHTSELQSRQYFVCRLLLEKTKYIG